MRERQNHLGEDRANRPDDPNLESELMTRQTPSRLVAALLLLIVGMTASAGGARGATPTPYLEMYNMTKYSATVIVERLPGGLAYGHYTLEPYGRAAIWGPGAFLFKGSVKDATATVTLPNKEITLVADSKTRGLIIEARGATFVWSIGPAASGAYM
jgi:hypothetical protein